MSREPSELGVGVVYVPGLEPLLGPSVGLVDVLEVEPQTLWVKDERGALEFPPLALDSLRAAEAPMLVHSVGNGVGGCHRPPPHAVQALARAARQLRSPWVSEHLSFNTVAGETPTPTGFMLPPLQTAAGVEQVVGSISELARGLPVPLVVETGVSYLRPRAWELPDGEFVSRVLERTPCHLLLDLHNLWTNERNGRQSVAEFLDSIPLDRVWEVHVAGGFELNGYWLDAHSGGVPEPLLELVQRTLPRLPNLKALVFEIFPSFIELFGVDAIGKQLELLRELWTQ